MSKVIQFSSRRLLQYLNKGHFNLNTPKNVRTFLSNAYYCQEIWEDRLKSPVIQNLNLDEFYHELDSAYQRNRNISPVDVDIFANAIKDDSHVDELLDLIHKLRLSAQACNMLDSTGHSVLRLLLNNKHYERLLQILDDRLNFGIFLDFYSANLLLDIFWKNKDYISGCKVAAQLMLQEDFTHPLNFYLSLLHCYKYLLEKPEGWKAPEQQPDTSEETKIRVKYLRNEFFDDHFDLTEPKHILGKTLVVATSNGQNDPLLTSLRLIGLELYEKHDQSKALLSEIKKSNLTLCTEILNLIDENEILSEAKKLKCESVDVEKFLVDKIKETEMKYSEKDISEQCKLFDNWEQNRNDALERQIKRLEIAQKLTDIEEAKKKLDEKELKLWFFDREEQLELDIEAKRVFYPKRWFGKKKTPKKIDEDYVPPEVKAKYKQNVA